MTLSLRGSRALVTGASSGIGAAVAESLAGLGVAVGLLARRRDRLAELAGRIAREGAGTAYGYEADVGDPEAVKAAVKAFAKDAGGIDILVNCAGVGAWGPAMEADLPVWRNMVEVNLSGVLVTTHAALPHVARAAAGPRGVADIVSISSIAGRKVPSANGAVYAATKHAVGAFSEGLRQELAGRHVRVGLVEPGMVATEMTTSGTRHAPDARRASGLGVLRPQDVADAVTYMVSRPRHAAVNEILIRPTEQVI